MSEEYDPYQDPQGNVVRSFDWRDWLKRQKTSIASYELTATGGCVLGASQRRGGRIYFFVAAPTDGTVECTITCADGQTYPDTLNVYAREA